MTKLRTSAIIVLLLLLGACKVGPNYQRPPLTVPDQYRGLAPDAGQQQQAGEQFAEMKWPAVFQDETLQALIKEALVDNYDMRIAAARIVESAANLGITRANQFPSVNGGFSVINQQATPLATGAPTFDTASIQLNYIVDFWGQYRRATEAAWRGTALGRRSLSCPYRPTSRRPGSNCPWRCAHSAAAGSGTRAARAPRR